MFAPKISVATPSLNSFATIRETIESVRGQDYPHWELIVMDGGSTDGALDILKQYPHLVWLSKKEAAHHAMNKASSAPPARRRTFPAQNIARRSVLGRKNSAVFSLVSWTTQACVKENIANSRLIRPLSPAAMNLRLAQLRNRCVAPRCSPPEQWSLEAE
jgi:glycosyltransferase involved in cell wall biosynthesis